VSPACSLAVIAVKSRRQLGVDIDNCVLS